MVADTRWPNHSRESCIAILAWQCLNVEPGAAGFGIADRSKQEARSTIDARRGPDRSDGQKHQTCSGPDPTSGRFLA